MTFAISNGLETPNGIIQEPPHEFRAVFKCFCKDAPILESKDAGITWGWRHERAGHVL